MLSDRIRQRRERLGYTQDELAEYTGTSLSQISRIERGLSDPTADVLYRVSKALRCSADYLLGLVDNPDSTVTDQLSDMELRLVSALRKGELNDLLDMIGEHFQELLESKRSITGN